MNVSSAHLRTLLREQFGYDAFRPGQERVIRSILAGRDVLAILPTGAGKSLPFQLAAQLLPGVTLVVSPLLALMKDQAESVQARGLEVGVVNSAQAAVDSRESIERAQSGATKLLYVTPERLEDEAFIQQAREMAVSLIVVDEAHCISQWGFDFRPAYLGLRDAIARLGHPTVLALTATATPWVRADLIQHLGLRDADVVVRGVDRPNLFFEVCAVQDEAEDYRVLRELFTGDEGPYPPDWGQPLARAMQGSGIIYTATTKGAQETASWLREWGIAADYYHGQRRKSDRERVQNAFMSGETRVIAATNAFGLGVDKPDVRFVIHRDVPASVEAYYQEAGRAGRDGEFARCTLIYRPADLGRAAFLSGHGQLSPEDVVAVHRASAGHSEVTLPELAESTGLSRVRLRRVIDLLARHDLLRTRGPRVRFRSTEWNPGQVSLQDEENRKEYERSRLQMMRGYAELRNCRRRYLLNYFGEEQEAPRCGCCDCDVLAEVATDDAPSPFQMGALVEHPTWGDGEITGVQGDLLVVRFRSGEERRLSAAVAQENDLLTVRSAPTEPQGEDQEGFHLGDPVTHTQYGPGVVQRVTPESVTVLFETSGYHTLDLERVVEEGLLESTPSARDAA